MCKYGTHGATLAYLFDKPVVDKCMDAIIGEGVLLNDNNLRYQKIVGVHITGIRDDNFVFLERF